MNRRAPGLVEQGFGWNNTFGSGGWRDTITSGLEGAWTTEPAKWDNNFFDNLFGYEWELTKSPAGAKQWTRPIARPTDVPDAHDPREASRADDADDRPRAPHGSRSYEPISRRFHENPDEFAEAFARAWFKLTHRDMGPHRALPRPEVP